MTYATVSTVVTALHMPEEVFAEAPAVLGWAPGDLGRYKGGSQVIFCLDETTVPLATLTRWLRGHAIKHDIDVVYEWIDVPFGDDEGEDRYREDVQTLIDGFRYDVCSSCGKDLSQHTIRPDPLTGPQLSCAHIQPSQASGG